MLSPLLLSLYSVQSLSVAFVSIPLALVSPSRMSRPARRATLAPSVVLGACAVILSFKCQIYCQHWGHRVSSDVACAWGTCKQGQLVERHD